MIEFLKLVANENMKIYSRIRTWIMLGILALFNVLMPVLLKLTGAPLDIWTAFSWTESFTFLLNIIFTVVIAADLVAGEFTWGTIKLLLIRPWSRGKILLSKFFALLIFSLLGTAVVAVIGILSSSLLFSGGASQSINLEITDFTTSLLTLLTDYVELFIVALIAFMISTVFRSGSLAIGLSILMIFTKDLIGILFNPEKYEWAKYILFLHMDLGEYIKSPVGPGGVGIGFSIAVLVGYCLLFMLITWWSFSKRDVAA
ncbi:ABC transporter permease [Paenibacillus dakarensis]|uniref:ABC transporter permease n=1 Tax=Paenibacillus dakarensis TaxID=1527293 RepID=UPI0006D55F61|nr:ABC transporter permease [Paenibacillus dakarensis]